MSVQTQYRLCPRNFFLHAVLVKVQWIKTHRFLYSKDCYIRFCNSDFANIVLEYGWHLEIGVIWKGVGVQGGSPSEVCWEVK